MNPTAENLQYWRLSPDSYAQMVSGGKWILWPHLEFMAKIVRDAIYEGNGRLIFTTPPRHGKSEFFSHWLPVWFFDLWPDKRIILASYGDRLARFFGRRIKSEVEGNPSVQVKTTRESHSSVEFDTAEGGGLMASGIGGALTGRGANLIVIDDPIKTLKEAMSAVVRESQKEWFKSTLYTRLEPMGTIILIMTRWHEDDLAGWLLKEHEDKWKVINLPALAEMDDLLGRIPGAPLCSERFDENSLQIIKKSVGERLFQALYQGHPTPMEGSILKRNWWKRWTTLPQFQEQKQSWDTTIKEDGSSYVVGQVWGKAGADKYLLDQIRGKWGMTELIEKFRSLTAKWPQAHRKEVEAKANGPAVENVLRKEIPGIILVEPSGGKEVRAIAIEPQLQAGNLWIPQDEVMYPWVQGFIEECATFPNSDNDDQVDAMTQAILNWNKGTLAFGGKERQKKTPLGGLT